MIPEVYQPCAFFITVAVIGLLLALALDAMFPPGPRRRKPKL